MFKELKVGDKIYHLHFNIDNQPIKLTSILINNIIIENNKYCFEQNGDKYCFMDESDVSKEILDRKIECIVDMSNQQETLFMGRSMYFSSARCCYDYLADLKKEKLKQFVKFFDVIDNSMDKVFKDL